MSLHATESENSTNGVGEEKRQTILKLQLLIEIGYFQIHVSQFF
jgi:hypothetical protein